MQGVTNPVGPSPLYCIQYIPLCDYVQYFFICFYMQEFK